jgi:hypothetical protein
MKNRSKKYHSVHDFSDIFEINEINAPSQSQFDNLLSEYQTFNSKEQLQWAINEYHIRKNIEVETERSSKSILVMICKQQPRCFWRLYVACPEGSSGLSRLIPMITYVFKRLLVQIMHN